MVETILQATVRLLVREGAAGITTNKIAQEADVDIASLYAYFGSKEAILLELTERWLQQIYAILEKYEKEMLAGMSIITLLKGIHHDITQLDDTQWGYSELVPLTDMIAPLREVEQAHETKLAQFLANVFQHYGSPWPYAKLLNFGRMYYVQMDAMLVLAARLPAPEARQVLRWQKRSIVALLKQCFDLR